MGTLKKGINDLLTWCQNNEYGELLISQWEGEDEKGNKISMEEVAANSHKKVWWKCGACGHRWKANPNNRVSYNSNCPLCKGKGKEAILYYWCMNNGDFGKQLLKEWTGEDEDGNLRDLKKITCSSSVRMKWKCPKCGDEWTVRIADRVRYKTGCPKCRNRQLG